MHMCFPARGTEACCRCLEQITYRTDGTPTLRKCLKTLEHDDIRATESPHPIPLPKGDGAPIAALVQLPLPIGEGWSEGSNYTNQIQSCHDFRHQNSFETVSCGRHPPQRPVIVKTDVTVRWGINVSIQGQPVPLHLFVQECPMYTQQVRGTRLVVVRGSQRVANSFLFRGRFHVFERSSTGFG